MATAIKTHFPYAALALFGSLVTAGQVAIGLLVGAVAVALLPVFYPDETVDE
jgi:hypothetical protein